MQWHYRTAAGQAARPAFLQWRDVVHDAFAGLESYSTTGGPEFHAALEMQAATGLRLGRIAGSAHRVQRTPRQANRIEADEIGLLLQVQGRAELVIDGSRVDMVAGDLAVFDNARPYTFELDGFEQMLLLVERRSLGPERERIDARRGTRLADSLPARLLRQALAEIGGAIRTPAATNMEGLAVPLVAWFAAACAEAEPGGVQRRADALFERIVADARRRIDDAELDTARLAARHGISARYLHKLFTARGLTPMGWLRDERLTHVERALRAGRAIPAIEATARRYGFDDLSVFRKAYRRRFGRSAKDTVRALRDAASREPGSR